MKKRYHLLLILFTVSVALSCTAPKENPRELSEEDAHIESVLVRSSFHDAEGNEVYLADFKGKVVLIDFWETWCGPCLQVFPAIDSLKAEYGENFEVLAVNTLTADTENDFSEFISENDYDFNFLLDANNVGAEVISLGIPFKIFFDPDGFLIKSELGSSGTEGDYLMAKTVIEDNIDL